MATYGKMAARPYYAKYFTYQHRYVYRRAHRALKSLSLLKVVIPVALSTVFTLALLTALKSNVKADISSYDIRSSAVSIDITEEVTVPITTEYEVSSVIVDDITSTERVIEYATLERELTLEEMLGQDEIVIGNTVLHRYDTPDKYYEDLTDFSSFQPWMDYRMITNTRSQAYKISHSSDCYTDSTGLRRYVVSEDQFSIDGIDDYVVAMGTFYKPKGQCGLRFLIVTTNGMFTIITGDEKADKDTDTMNMFTLHKHGTVAAIIEWIVDVYHLNSKIKSSGTVTEGPIDVLNGDILYVYRIEEDLGDH